VSRIIRPLQYPVGGGGGSRSYQIQEFARLAGITVRALQHYDRLGLLSPARTATGARLYSTADLQALVQILALKSVGVPLKKIGSLRAIGPRAMAEALEAERRALERKQPLIDRVIFAIRNVESALGRGEEADPAVLTPLMAALKSDQGEAARHVRVTHEPSPAWDELKHEWQQLLTDIERADALDPAGSELQEMAARWDQLMMRSTGGGSYRLAFLQNAATLESPADGRVVSGEKIFAKVGVALRRMVAQASDLRGPRQR
jgi:DNA-binding transcriptional MerR regulator